MSPDEQKAFRLYGVLPKAGPQLKKFEDKNNQRKYFDSGDYMLAKAGIPTGQIPGTAIPTPEGVPHAASPPGATSPGLSSSPTNMPLHSPGTGEATQSKQSGQNGAPSLAQPVPSVPNPGVGMGISPSASSDAVEVPHNHRRRPSEGARISPPGVLRDLNHSSSYVIHHPGSSGLSPVKSSALARRLDNEFENDAPVA
ncbi:hypothetical protein M231_02230 [Tremella mesenterica]|uniref:mRNA stability protein n=2 Tax=Tremella mesenterica TaxID=5217 RepID=A0A4V1M4H6_TREME|nr:hypothetical protein M231_02230 [Tremella mesenterica]